MLARFRPYLSFWTVCLAAIAADVATKLLVVRRIPFGAYFADDPGCPPVVVFPWFWIVHVGNKGAAWGLGAEHDVRPFLIFLALAVLALVWRWRRPLLRELQGGQLAFGLFVGGTLGNVRDRLFGDHVIDFLDVHLPYYRFPAFNVADASICVGVGLYVVMSYRQDRLRREAIISHGGEDPPARRMSVRFDLAAHPGAHAYRLLAGLVVPRPIALVTTLDAAGVVNAAPFSFFNVMGAEPAIAVLAPADRDDGTPKDTAANLHANGECVIHVCDEAVAARMVECARPLPPGVSEVPRAGFSLAPSERVRVPRLVECPVALEGRVLDIRRYGDNRLVVIELLLAHVREGVADPATWKVDYARYAPVGRMNSPDGYARTTDRFTLRFPSEA